MNRLYLWNEYSVFPSPYFSDNTLLIFIPDFPIYLFFSTTYIGEDEDVLHNHSRPRYREWRRLARESRYSSRTIRTPSCRCGCSPAQSRSSQRRRCENLVHSIISLHTQMSFKKIMVSVDGLHWELWNRRVSEDTIHPCKVTRSFLLSYSVLCLMMLGRIFHSPGELLLSAFPLGALFWMIYYSSELAGDLQTLHCVHSKIYITNGQWNVLAAAISVLNAVL